MSSMTVTPWRISAYAPGAPGRAADPPALGKGHSGMAKSRQRARFFDRRSGSEPGADHCAQSGAEISAEGACELYIVPAHWYKLFALLLMLSFPFFVEAPFPLPCSLVDLNNVPLMTWLLLGSLCSLCFYPKDIVAFP